MESVQKMRGKRRQLPKVPLLKTSSWLAVKRMMLRGLVRLCRRWFPSPRRWTSPSSFTDLSSVKKVGFHSESVSIDVNSTVSLFWFFCRSLGSNR